MGLIRRISRFSKDCSGIAPIIWAIVLIGGTVVGIAGYKVLVERPDITYNITDAGISIAGLDIGNDMLIIITIGVVFLILWFAGRKKD